MIKKILLVLLFALLMSGCNLFREARDSSSVSMAHDKDITASPSPLVVDVTPSPTETAHSATPTPLITAVPSYKGDTLPILYYHAVSDDIKEGMPELFVSPSEFKMQMDYLKKNGYEVITFDDLPNLKNYKKPVIITFDDGYENNYTDAYPILKSYNFKAVIFLATDFINKEDYLKEDQIKKMTDIIKFESHTVTHSDLTKLDKTKLAKEFSESEKIIEGLTGQKLTAFAYPLGYFNNKVIEVLKKYYKYAVTTQSGLYKVNSDSYQIKRVYIPRNTTISKFEKRLGKGSL